MSCSFQTHSSWEDAVIASKKARLRFLIMASLVLLAGCGSAMDPAVEIELQAQSQVDINGVQAELRGQFRIEAEGTRLTGELDNSNFPANTAISFCLVKSSMTIPLAAPETNTQGVALFELNTQNGQTVPRVNVGDKIEARQGATASAGTNCTAPLLASATFQLDVNQPNH
jgi:hypothetical protein